MKICIIDFDFTNFGGVEHVTASIANKFAEDFETHILSLCSSGSPDGKAAYKLDSRIKYHNLGLKRTHLREMFKSFKKPIFEYIKSNEIDVAILQGHWAGFVATGACKSAKAKVIFCDHGSLKNQWNEKDAVVMRLSTAIRCNKLVTLTNINADDYCRILPVRKKTRCIYNWVDTENYKFDGYDCNSRKIVSAGRFTKEKGFNMLLEVMQKVAKKCPDCVLDIYGDGELRSNLENQARELGIESNVNFMGMCDNLNTLYKNYAMYVMPSYREGLPLVLLEAKSCGLPIVSFDIMTGPSDIVANGKDGILIPPYDIEKMADSICELLQNPDLRSKMSEFTQTDIGRFSKQKIYGDWLNLIDELV